MGKAFFGLSKIIILMNDKLVILGTGTCELRADRMASSVLVHLHDCQLNGRYVLFDIGRGIANRLAQLKLKSDDIEHIILSHFHPDHV